MGIFLKKVSKNFANSNIITIFVVPKITLVLTIKIENNYEKISSDLC